MTKGQQRAMDELMPQFGIEFDGNEIDFTQAFSREAPTILEIGFGDGEALLSMASQRPDANFLGAEVHRPGVGRLLLNVEQEEIQNIRVFCQDGADVLQHAIPDGSLSGINLFFPDPWHKKKHHKRRILQPSFVDLVCRKLKPSGVFHFATDWEPYALETLALLDQEKRLRNQAGANSFSPRPEFRPVTKFERRGIRLGHGVWDILMELSSSKVH